LRSTRWSTARLFVVIVWVLGGFIAMIAGAVKGDPESRTFIFIFIGLIAVQATLLILLRLYWDPPTGQSWLLPGLPRRMLPSFCTVQGSSRSSVGFRKTLKTTNWQKALSQSRRKVDWD
jgi:hypothetical protein